MGLLVLRKNNKSNQILVKNVKKHVSDIIKFLSEYQWIIDAYVSDFFVCNFWKRLPHQWTGCLTELSAPQMAGFLDPKEHKCSTVLPLSLLAFRACTQALSLNRTCADIEALRTEEDIFQTHQQSTECMVTTDREMDNTTKEPWQDPRGDSPGDLRSNLHHFYRKHVKPKKQHEISQLGQVIKLLSSQIGCDHVVDVGAGLGHLSRILTFGLDLKVTTVEASGGHAPKASKYDREIEREIKKKKAKRREQTTDDDGTADFDSNLKLPSHVTCTISPNTSTEEFLRILEQRCDFQSNWSDEQPSDIWQERAPGGIANCCGDSVRVKSQDSSDDGIVKSSVSNSSTCRPNGCKDSTCETEIRSSKVVEENEVHQTTDSGNLCDSQITDCEKSHLASNQMSNCYTKQSQAVLNKDISNSKLQQLETYEYSTAPVNTEGTNTRYSHTLSNQSSNPEWLDCGREHSSVDEEIECSHVEKQSSRKRTVCADGNEFILTGLHACGDLTSTFLRVFVNCPLAKGLASVGCCYMKLSCHSRSSRDPRPSGTPGYPMSEAVESLPNHHLTYEARELACHFADTYCQRLLANSHHLHTHCYRSALQYIITQTAPDFLHGCVKIAVKNVEDMPFELYVEKGLQKLGLQTEVDPTLLQTAKKFLSSWKNVVAFYTLRLSIAPVVETLLLLDRLLYLYEQGYSAALIPIFNPEISPRNFVLLGW